MSERTEQQTEARTPAAVLREARDEVRRRWVEEQHSLIASTGNNWYLQGRNDAYAGLLTWFDRALELADGGGK